MKANELFIGDNFTIATKKICEIWELVKDWQENGNGVDILTLK